MVPLVTATLPACPSWAVIWMGAKIPIYSGGALRYCHSSNLDLKMEEWTLGGREKAINGKRVQLADIVKMYAAGTSFRCTFYSSIDTHNECVPTHQLGFLGRF